MVVARDGGCTLVIDVGCPGLALARTSASEGETTLSESVGHEGLEFGASEGLEFGAGEGLKVGPRGVRATGARIDPGLLRGSGLYLRLLTGLPLWLPAFSCASSRLRCSRLLSPLKVKFRNSVSWPSSTSASAELRALRGVSTGVFGTEVRESGSGFGTKYEVSSLPCAQPPGRQASKGKRG